MQRTAVASMKTKPDDDLYMTFERMSATKGIVRAACLSILTVNC